MSEFYNIKQMTNNVYSLHYRKLDYACSVTLTQRI